MWDGIWLGFLGLSAGAITATGFFAVITAVGLINRVAAVTKTTDRLLLYEEIIIVGAVLGTILSIMDVSINGSLYMAGEVLLALVGVLSGMYVGLFVVSLAETSKALPIFIRRVRIGAGLGLIILMIGIGKAIGHLIYYLVLYV